MAFVIDVIVAGVVTRSNLFAWLVQEPPIHGSGHGSLLGYWQACGFGGDCLAVAAGRFRCYERACASEVIDAPVQDGLAILTITHLFEILVGDVQKLKAFGWSLEPMSSKKKPNRTIEQDLFGK